MSQTDDIPTVVHYRRWRAGDAESFAVLHRRLLPTLRGNIRRHSCWAALEQQHAVEDIVQDAWMAATQGALDRFEDRGPGSLLAFVTTIAHRRMLDLHRRILAQKRGGGAVQSLATGFEPERAMPDRPIDATPTNAARTSELLRVARERLSEQQFTAWELVELQGYTSVEAGEVMELSDSRVRNVLRAARVELMMALGGESASG